ncbi:MAG: nucleotidyltransferase [Clostridiales bacterium]|nr:nucleotidyltransferase [Candidatus Crickella caballi]
MNAVGIIAEYNPLHNGHVYHMKEALRIAGSDAVVVAMSGNYVQRGEPAIVDKWSRAEAAVRSGANLVIEIPTIFCLGNAKQYASAGVALLESVNCVTQLAFGSESGDIDGLCRVAGRLNEKNEEIAQRISAMLPEGLSFPAARERAYREIYSDSEFIDSDIELLRSSNDILALEYIRACSRLSTVAVRRSGAGYTETGLTQNGFQSATAIRNAVAEGCQVDDYVPEYMNDILAGNRAVKSDDVLSILRYAVMNMAAEDIDKCPSGGEGLGNKIKSCIDTSESIDELINAVKSKRYTYSRISRLLIQILLGISNDKYPEAAPSYIRVLAADRKGRDILAEMRDGALPVITNLSKDSCKLDEQGLALLELDAHTSDIYNLISGRDIRKYSDYRMHPAMI